MVYLGGSAARPFSIGAAGLAIALLATQSRMQGQLRGQGRGDQPTPSARASAPFDPTGYWSSLITQNWRLRMVPPAKGDYIGIPISAAGKEGGRWVGPGQRRSGRKSMQGVRRARAHEPADASAHQLAGRQYASRGHRLRHADARAAFRRLDAAATTETELARQLGRGLGIAAWRARRRAIGTLSPDHHNRSVVRLPAQERRAVRRGHVPTRVR